MEIIDLLPDTPEMKAAQVWEWLKATGNAGQEVIRYTTERLRHPLTGASEWFAKCDCTACGAVWHEPLVAGGKGGKYKYFLTDDGEKSNGMGMTCPTCGTYAVIAHRRRLDDYPIIYKKYLWEIRKAGGCVMFINWLAAREIGYDYDSIEMCKRNAYVLDPGGRWHRFTAMERGGWSPMCRMEYIDTHTGEVIQNRGEKNCARTAAVQAFENAWLREVVKPWILSKQKATKNFAAPAA